MASPSTSAPERAREAPRPAAHRIVKGTTNEAAAKAFVDFLLSPPAQNYFAESNREIPLVEGIELPGGTPTVDELTVPDLDVRRLEDLQSARKLLTEVGIME
jgi:iron(III) transport system substrate-binding protein